MEAVAVLLILFLLGLFAAFIHAGRNSRGGLGYVLGRQDGRGKVVFATVLLIVLFAVAQYLMWKSVSHP